MRKEDFDAYKKNWIDNLKDTNGYNNVKTWFDTNKNFVFTPNVRTWISNTFSNESSVIGYIGENNGTIYLMFKNTSETEFKAIELETITSEIEFIERKEIVNLNRTILNTNLSIKRQSKEVFDNKINFPEFDETTAVDTVSNWNRNRMDWFKTNFDGTPENTIFQEFKIPKKSILRDLSSFNVDLNCLFGLKMDQTLNKMLPTLVFAGDNSEILNTPISVKTFSNVSDFSQPRPPLD
ncbi:hypothetical protein [Aureivirga sp. CE67]|uniref:hypothetical protein n=1 Tax=Aureivirga sp. CE67 TaxID=1788983 RepID=UPI0018C994DB|nr:hypothetical protein [Aureivirga sp. CE67]